jgi:hypothetical protein
VILMKKLFLLLILLNSMPAMAASNSGEFCVSTLNVYGPFYSSRRVERMGEIVDFIVKTPCEYWTFQELWLDGDTQFLKQLLTSNIEGSRFVGNQGEDRNGLAGFYAGSHNKTEFFAFEENYDGVMDFFRRISSVSKGFSVANIPLRNKNEVSLMSTHLHHASMELQNSQLDQILNSPTIKENENAVILTGDFNFEPDSDLYKKIITAGFRDVFKKRTPADCTYCADNVLGWGDRDRVIDFIFIRSGKGVSLSSSKTSLFGQPEGGAGEKVFSDHLGIRTQIKWKIKKAPSGG